MPPGRLSIALAALALLASGASAENTPSPGSDTPPEEGTEEIVILGVRGGHFERAPSAVGDVLFTDDFEGENKHLADLLSETRGVFVRRFGAAGDRAEVSIRGSTSAQVVVSIDGVRANSALTGGFDLSRVCLPLVERVEIIRGAGSDREGSGAIGGVIHLVPRSGREESATRVSFARGSFDTWEGSIFHADRLGAVDLHAGYCGFDTDGDFRFARPVFEGPGAPPAPFIPSKADRINNERTRHGGTFGIGTELGPGRIELHDYWVTSDGGEPGPDCCNGVLAGQNPRAHSRDWNNLALLRWRGEPPGPLGDDLTLRVHHHFEELEFRDPVQPFGAPIDFTTRLSSLGARLEDTWKLQLGGQPQQLRLSFDGEREDLRSTEQQSRTRHGAAAALAGELRLLSGAVLLVSSLRADWTEDFDLTWVPSFGAVISPTRWLRVRTNVGRAFRVPSFDELYHPDQGFIRGNPDLRAEDALNFDVEAELRLAQLGPLTNLEVSASYFRRVIDDSIVWVRISDTTIAPLNTDRANADGIEAALSFQLSPWLRFTFHHTELDSRRDDTGRRLPGQPDRESFGRLQIGAQGIWKLVGEAQYTGEIVVSEGGRRRLPDRTVWNASAAVDLASLPWVGDRIGVGSLWVFFAVDNIGDEAVRDTLAFPQPGRSASAGFEGRW